MKPEFEMASERAKGDLNFGAIDATAHRRYSSKYGVKGFPTILGFINGQDTKYEGGRKANDFINWYDSSSKSWNGVVRRKEVVPRLPVLTDESVAFFVEAGAQKKLMVFGGD